MANFETRLGRAEEMPLEANIADLVVSQFSLHEWEDPQKGLSEVFRVLKQGGSLMLRDLNRGWLSKWKLVLLRFLAALTGESYEEHLPMFKFALDQVAALLRQAGFDGIEERGRGLVLFVQAYKADLDATQKKGVHRISCRTGKRIRSAWIAGSRPQLGIWRSPYTPLIERADVVRLLSGKDLDVVR